MGAGRLQGIDDHDWYSVPYTRSGWTIVGGGEYGFTDRLSAFVEYGIMASAPSGLG